MLAFGLHKKTICTINTRAFHPEEVDKVGQPTELLVIKLQAFDNSGLQAIPTRPKE
jgi:hypothetical protein